MQYLSSATLEDFLIYTRTNTYYSEFVKKYQTKIDTMATLETDTFLKRLETMAYRLAMYHYKKTPVDIEQYLPKKEGKRYANFEHI